MNLSGVAQAQKVLRCLGSAQKNSILSALAERISANGTRILDVNAQDVSALAPEASPAYRDRLMVTPARLASLGESIRIVSELPDPVGEIETTQTRPDGLELKKVRAPIGTIFVIFESRPNVAVDAFILAIKSGNAIVLRGGSEAVRTLNVFYGLMREVLLDSGFWTAGNLPFLGVEDYDREVTRELLGNHECIDLVIPRGGDGLIDFVTENTKIPVLRNDRGMCHVYVHAEADLEWAKSIVKNAKTQRPGVCNAMETLLVDEKIAADLLPALAREIPNVQWRACPKSLPFLPGATTATSADWDTEYLDLILNCKVVGGPVEAIAHIARHGSGHSEAILTNHSAIADQFVAEVDAAAVYVNASTRFTDGGEMGMGAEIGISTQKLHARGPVGLRELTTGRWIVYGKGNIRK